jgi:hypothetical protein
MMTKELLISLVLAAVLLFCLVLGMLQSSLLSNPFFLLIGLATILGQVVMAHLAFSQYKNLTVQTINERDNDEERKEERKEERGSDGFDD